MGDNVGCCLRWGIHCAHWPCQIIVDVSQTYASLTERYSMTLIHKMTEKELWTEGRNILHFIGINGAGKTTLSNRLATRCELFGGKAIRTIDYHPHIPDHEHPDDRAFSRELDRLNNEAGRSDSNIHQQIVKHSLAQIERWKASDANVVVADRWYESYDGLPSACMDEIEDAIKTSGFRLVRVFLLVSQGLGDDSYPVMKARLQQTQTQRGESWEVGLGLEELVREEMDYQEEYRQFCLSRAGNAPLLARTTTLMAWDEYENWIADSLMHNKWFHDWQAWGNRRSAHGVPAPISLAHPDNQLVQEWNKLREGSSAANY